MSGDCGALAQKNLNAPLSSFAELLSKPFAKFTIEGLLEFWLEAEGLLKHKAIEGSQGDVGPKRLKLVEKCKVKPEWVWLQGYVVKVSKDCKSFQISDNPDTETGAVYSASSVSFHSVFIVHCMNAPAGINHSMKGRYCQVLGHILDFDELHGNLRVAAIKIADLSKLQNWETLKGMWTNEVLEGRKVENHLTQFQT